MVNIRLDVGRSRLWIWGHANAAPYGQDTVCAAVSTITLLAGMAAQRWEKQGWLKSPLRMSIAPGCALIICRPKRRYRRRIARLFTHWGMGLGLLARQFPQFINYTEKGGISHGSRNQRDSRDGDT